MTKEEAIDFLNSCKWNEAKSYSDTFPHFYTTRKLINNDKLFELFLKYLRKNSIIKKFYSKQYLYLELNDFEYWEMGRPIKAVEVLNKALIKDDEFYRYPFPAKEEEDKLKHKLNLRDSYLENLLKKNNVNQNELEEIKFLMNTERRIHGGGKNIIDHSSLEIKYK
jgi:hypothetical protein